MCCFANTNDNRKFLEYLKDKRNQNEDGSTYMWKAVNYNAYSEYGARPSGITGPLYSHYVYKAGDNVTAVANELLLKRWSWLDYFKPVADWIDQGFHLRTHFDDLYDEFSVQAHDWRSMLRVSVFPEDLIGAGSSYGNTCFEGYEAVFKKLHISEEDYKRAVDGYYTKGRKV